MIEFIDIVNIQLMNLILLMLLQKDLIIFVKLLKDSLIDFKLKDNYIKKIFVLDLAKKSNLFSSLPVNIS
jgi:hypothetical protein